MTVNRNNEPGNRMRKILYDSEIDSSKGQQPHPTRQPSTPQQSRAPSSEKTQTIVAQPVYRSAPPRKIWVFGPPFWTVTGCLSLVVNAVLIAILFSLMPLLGSLQITAGDMGTGLLGGLYTNFERMEKAHIRANVPVNLDDVPVNFILNYSTDTEVILTADTPIQANVSITSGIVNINGPANIILRKDTRLPIHLNLQIPVNTTVDIADRELPVDIELASTDLNEAFVGLKNVVKPYYCLVKPSAVDLDQKPVCK